MKQQIYWLGGALLWASSLVAQSAPADSAKLDARTEWKNSRISSVGRAPLRNEFVSYDIREVAQRRDKSAATHYLPLNMFETTREGVRQLRTRVDIPYMWLDRDVFIHIEGVPTLYLTINDKVVGYATDSRTPVEFNISKGITNGLNSIGIELIDGGLGEKMDGPFGATTPPEVYIYSQPKLRIENYRITTPDDSLGKHTIFTVEIAVSNSYNSDEPMQVGYDIYSPQGKLLNFDSRDVTIPGNGRDTVLLEHVIYGSAKTKWSTQTPQLYRVMLYVKRDGRLIEYIPLMSGVSEIELRNGQLYRNGSPVNVNAARYNAAADRKKTEAEIKQLKTHGVNTVCVDYPQVYWFYDVCDALGMNVIDQANVNSDATPYDRNIGGSLSNDPAWTAHFVERAQTMYNRSRDHVCIIGWSLGGSVGNGYNMYKAYQWLKSVEPDGAVIFRDSQGEWNSDMEMPELRDAQTLLSAPAPAPKPTPRRR